MHLRSSLRLAVIALVALTATLLTTAPTTAQLVTVERDYRVTAIDAAHSRIQVTAVDSEKDTGSVLVTRETKLFVLGKELPNFSWRLLQKGMKISVVGGMTWDMKIKAKQIHLL